MANIDEPRRVTAVLFHGFELLDVFGPLEVFGTLSGRFQLTLAGPLEGPVRSAQGPSVLAEFAYEDAPAGGIVLVPGGIGTRQVVRDRSFCSWILKWASSAEFLVSVCTGSGVLAAAGLLDGYRATSNKQAFGWARAQGPNVEWIPEARWTEDRTRWTSSGVAAGMDMALALIERLHGEEAALNVADGIEYEWHRDARWDPFAAKNGLVL